MYIRAASLHHLEKSNSYRFVVLYIAEASEQDAGYYVFHAENDIGDAETSATVLVVPSFDTTAYLDGENIVDVDDVRELQSGQDQGKMHSPKFVQPPRDFHCDAELGRSYFDARIAPVYDSSLRVQWLKVCRQHTKMNFNLFRSGTGLENELDLKSFSDL